ncbi:MAG: GPW/gp25 family protein [Actinomycetota bacterium]
MSATADFVGSGWAFPVRTSPTGGIALSAGAREIEESIRIIVSTAHGERPMRPDFGCRIHDYVFSPASPGTIGRIRQEVRESLARWEPRVDLHDVDVALDPDRATTLLVQVSYSVRGTNDPRNLVFPFYVLPPEDSSPSAEGGRT